MNASSKNNKDNLLGRVEYNVHVKKIFRNPALDEAGVKTNYGY